MNFNKNGVKMCYCFLRRMRKHLASSSYITGTMSPKQSYSKVSFIAYGRQYTFALSSQRNNFVGINEYCQIKGNNLGNILSMLYENN